MKNIIISLLGAVFACVVAIYNALCPIFNQEISITILVVWKQAKYQFLGLFVISMILLLTLILRYHVQTLWHEYYYWLLDQMITDYLEIHFYYVAA
ncbi:hypothetical protein ACS2U0_18290 [Bacillus cereus group sp. BC251]|jgi:hypothetical protein|uniref:hypothetical protein n=1 Tax=Bacillus cereus group TaxID=86661 RepID=UPI000C32A33C|nr:hypothetical protein [Bacillus sp. HBCD-sjtu]AUD24590.1 hypothetical protein CU648_20010 [Bacillus sp. HBCD-sjtu]HDR4391394.1 hypothetical protein [Bacillus cereus]HDR4599419.1 hypothetical protein [Bacillus cereus]HDR4657012.1 hypothetical protein [Bacillus cereus]